VALGCVDPVAQSFHEVATPATNSNPYGITVDASNDVWFTENTDAVALIGEYTANGTLNEYKIRNTQTGWRRPYPAPDYYCPERYCLVVRRLGQCHRDAEPRGRSAAPAEVIPS